MDQDPKIPQGPQGETPNPDVGGTDISRILLPKKPVAGATVDSASRVNAGVLLDQEQKAELPATPKPALVAPPAKPKEESVVKSVETYQGDIEKLVQNKNVSVVSIAAAEAARRAGGGEAPVAPKERSPFLINTTMVGVGILLLVGAAAAIIFVLKPAPAVNVYVDAPTPFIAVDEVKAFTVPQALLQHIPAMDALESQRENVSLSLGLMAQIFLALPQATTTATVKQMGAHQLLGIIGPHIPDTLLRAIHDEPYLIGIHSYDGNQPFLILQTDSYEQAFSGMLEWERWMQQDLSPLFVRTPRAHIPEEGIATSSPTSTPAFVQTGFIDRIVENHDARVIENNTKDILLMWAFLNRNILVITTNEATLREIISRLRSAPVVPLP